MQRGRAGVCFAEKALGRLWQLGLEEGSQVQDKAFCPKVTITGP